MSNWYVSQSLTFESDKITIDSTYTATKSNTVLVETSTLNTDHFIPYVTGNGSDGYEDLERSTSLKINPSTGILTVTGGLSGQLIAGANISFSEGTTYDGRQDITISSTEGGTTTNSITNGDGIETFSFDGSTAGVQVAVDFGSSSSTLSSQAVACNDTRLSDTRVNPFKLIKGNGLAFHTGIDYDGSVERTIKVNFGLSSSTSASQAVTCADSRLSDERYTPYNLVPGDGL